MWARIQDMTELWGCQLSREAPDFKQDHTVQFNDIHVTSSVYLVLC